MKLKDIEVQRSKVYVTIGKSTFRYGIMILGSFGDFEVVGIHIINGSVYIEVKECN